MVLEDFLKVIGGEIVRLERGGNGIYLYEADKNAIRAYRADLLDREIYMVEPMTKNKFKVQLSKPTKKEEE